MNVAIIKDITCIDAAIFDDIETAQQFLDEGVWPEADSVTELPDGYGIGDFYDGFTWTKKPQPEPEPETDSDIDPQEKIQELKVQINAMQEQVDQLLAAR